MYRRRPSSSHPEAGYILLAVLFMVALVLIALAVAAPRISADIQRDREDDLYHRGLQYKRAIKLYYKKFGSYPTSIDQLENTNNMRFLRHRYVDPMTGKDDWKIIHFGEAHVQAMGLFGQPIQAGGMSATAGGSMLGGGGTPGLNAPNVGTPISSITSVSSSSSSTDSSSSTASGTDTSGSSPSGTSGTGTTGPGMTSGTSGTTGGTSAFGSSSSSGGFGSSGSSMGGAPMVGVVSKSTKASIREYKKQKHYNEWEFVYDPMEDLLSSVSLLGGGTSNVNGTSGTSSGTTTPGSGSSYGPGSGSGFGSGFGSTGSFGSGSGSTPTPPTSPQQ